MTATEKGTLTTSTWQSAGLTDRQTQILQLRDTNGLSLRETAYALDLSVSTVRSHLEAADRKLEIHRRKRAA